MFNVVCFIGFDDETTSTTFPTNIEDIIEEIETDRPVIGIVSMPIQYRKIIENINIAKDKLHIDAAFVKLLEGAGARVVPLLEKFDDTKIQTIFGLINGVLLPGGLEDIIESNYQRISKLAFQYSISKSKTGETWPVLGICRGFQMLFTIFDEGKDLEIATDALNLSLPLEFTKEANTSRLMAHAPPRIWKYLKEENITFNLHIHGFTPGSIRNDDKLNKHWRIISTNKDRKGKEFISTMEGQ